MTGYIIYSLFQHFHNRCSNF